jgi:hypothetical protein
MDRLLEIESLILKKTAHCRKNFDCLRDQNDSSCLNVPVTYCVGAKILFVKCTDRTCQYRMSYGHNTVCNCLTRLEIYKKHRK